MSADQFRKFLADQGDAGDDAESVIEKGLQLGHRQHLRGKLAMPAFTLDDFHRYLFSAELNPPIRSQVPALLFCDQLLHLLDLGE